ncbi:prepilin-type N-terminal cleavage/methylation domain-containing protein, partial [Clostridium baratii]
MNKNKVMKKKKKGFTLIELIAVVAILAILAAVAVPRVIKYVDKSKRVAVQTEASTIYNAAEAAYNDGKLVDTTSGKSN